MDFSQSLGVAPDASDPLPHSPAGVRTSWQPALTAERRPQTNVFGCHLPLQSTPHSAADGVKTQRMQ